MAKEGTEGITPATVEGGTVVPEQGAEQQAPTGPPSGGEPTKVQESFYGYTFPDGTQKSWNTRDEMDKDFRDSYFREKDYYQKTRDLAEQRKQFEAQQSDLAKSREEMDRMRKEYDDFQWMIQNRPEVYQYLQKQSTTPPDAGTAFSRAQKYADDQISELKKELKELKDAQLNRDLERQRDSVYEEMGNQFPDFDRQRVSDLLDEIGSGDLQKIVRVLYHADSGMRGAQAAGSRIAKTEAEKQAAKLTPGTGTGRAERPAPKNLDDAAKLAEREYAGIIPEYE
jgi:chaperonin cofactor prefoldin